ncbi:MAG: nicotinate phosphoribosyltransferase [Gammaproteobacteria bacterium]|nr:nicotinate phosphoribosyltransferase [Gammaproteobacteria bacterium]MCI0591409.1 nicotinate phosphoribosyltransferase [Gammaproteobacteria bacterium]
MHLCNSPLLTDLYQLTMLQGYFDQGMTDQAVFEFFVRKLPPKRNFLIAAGLEQALEFLEGFAFTTDELDWLADCGHHFSEDFLDFLGDLRFTGDVHAMPEGTIFFPDEPILRITAPIPEAQIVESRIINLLQFQTLIASKAIRSVLAAPNKFLVDFGLRRSHGAEAGLLAARACYMVGFSGTATVLADKVFGIPTYGTMAHSFVMAHEDEAIAFQHFAKSQPDNVTLLIDTYDESAAIDKIIRLAPSLKRSGIYINAVRIDSGDLGKTAIMVREMLDKGGLGDTQIFASGDLDETALERLLRERAPIDGFGVGTRMSTSEDAPSLNCAYKLQEYAGRARRKRSAGKQTWPGRKQVYRLYNGAGTVDHDVLALEDERQDGEALIQCVMQGGQRVSSSATLTEIRERVMTSVCRLPSQFRQIDESVAFKVQISQRLQELTHALDQELH